jgi:hypothetical protein
MHMGPAHGSVWYLFVTVFVCIKESSSLVLERDLSGYPTNQELTGWSFLEADSPWISFRLLPCANTVN